MKKPLSMKPMDEAGLSRNRRVGCRAALGIFVFDILVKHNGFQRSLWQKTAKSPTSGNVDSLHIDLHNDWSFGAN